MINRKLTRSEKPKDNIFQWVDAGLKVVIAIIGIAISYIGYEYQKSLTTSQLLVQQEKGDTDIRAQMFGKITDRLMQPEQGKASPVQDALLAQVLALNFHELIELKPLMIDLDKRLSRGIDQHLKSHTNNNSNESNTELEDMRNAQENLRSTARRIRDRQVAALINNPGPRSDNQEKMLNINIFSSSDEAGKIQYINVLREGMISKNACRLEEYPGENGCLGEPMILRWPEKGSDMYISIDSADWNKEIFQVSLNLGKFNNEITLPNGETEKITEKSKEKNCGKRDNDKIKEKISEHPTIRPGFKSFQLTWFDFPYTDNTLQANGDRYAVFIDRICKAAEAGPDDAPNAVRLGILYFPKDYYPSRERPVSYKQLDNKLSLNSKN